MPETSPAEAARSPESELVESLRRTRLWRDVADPLLVAAARHLRSMRFAAGDVLIQQGQAGSHMHLLTSGRVEVRATTEEGTVVTISTLAPGECFGEMSLLTGEAASADVVALEPSETLTLDAEAFRAIVSTSPVLLQQFVRILSQRLTSTDHTVATAREKEQYLTHFLRDVSRPEDDLVGTGPAVKARRREIERFAGSDTPLLVWGEVGTGRELVARLVHSKSSRREALALAADCAQIAASDWGDRLLGACEGGGAQGRVLSYLDLADGGTLVLKDLEHLPMAVQERLAAFLETRRTQGTREGRDVRVIATCEADPAGLAASGRIAPSLAAAFGENRIAVTPLRERKRDLPVLADHYLKKHARRTAKPAVRIDDQALAKLLAYDYRIANDRELEQAVERAVILTDGDTVRSEEIFLGPPPRRRARGLNVLRLERPDPRRLAGLLPRVGRVAAAGFFLFILYEAFFGPRDPETNLATTLVWSLWWPLLALSFFFMGRAWCAVCPMGEATSSVQRVQKTPRPIPGWIKNHDYRIVMAGLFLIVLAEEASGMRHSPTATGLLLLAILAGAVVVGLLYPRRTWCRHFCPLGGLAGVCATSGLVELRPTADICSAKCKGHSCYKGDHRVPGCPMFNHVMFVDSNQHCTLCLNCVQSCPNSSPQLNLRLPGPELWSAAAARPEFGFSVLFVMGLLVGMTCLQYVERTAPSSVATMLADHRLLLAGALLAVCAALPIAAFWLLQRRAPGDPASDDTRRLWGRVAALAPLVTAGFVAYQLEYVPGLRWMQTSFLYGFPGAAVPVLSLPVLSAVRLVLVMAGLATTLFILSRAVRAQDPRERAKRVDPTPARNRAALPLLSACYSGLLLALMLAP